MSINDLVIIPTAGKGTRLGHFTKDLNKALLPYKGKPIISHIIEQFPLQSKFLIPIGYLGTQIVDYCSLTYPDLDFEFIVINDWDSVTGGTGSTLRQCANYVDRPFWYVPCDTIFNETLDHSLTEDCYFVSKVEKQLHKEYTTFSTENNRVLDIAFKKSTSDNYLAFTGLMFINDHLSFFQKLCNHIGNEFIDILQVNTLTRPLQSWIDVGNFDIYSRARMADQDYDFSKTEEITYLVNNKVVKWYKDAKISNLKYQRYNFNKTVFPDNCLVKPQFLKYDYFNGSVLYDDYSIRKFEKLLEWLEKKVWVRTDLDLNDTLDKFYKKKTLDRIEQFKKKYLYLPNITKINDLLVRKPDYYLNKINWSNLITKSIPCFIHGDLHFDNVVIDRFDNFRIIDWRYGFEDSVIYGDLYYDLAKLAGGLIINYSQIKKNNFQVDILIDEVRLQIPSVEDLDQYEKILEEFISRQNLDYEKVKLLIPIIFWNMAPLHHKPFDLFLWYLGLYYFAKFFKFQQ